MPTRLTLERHPQLGARGKGEEVGGGDAAAGGVAGERKLRGIGRADEGQRRHRHCRAHPRRILVAARAREDVRDARRRVVRVAAHQELVDAAAQLEALSKYTRKQPVLRMKLRSIHSATALRITHATAQDRGPDIREIKVAIEIAHISIYVVGGTEKSKALKYYTRDNL